MLLPGACLVFPGSAAVLAHAEKREWPTFPSCGFEWREKGAACVSYEWPISSSEGERCLRPATVKKKKKKKQKTLKAAREVVDGTQPEVRPAMGRRSC